LQQYDEALKDLSKLLTIDSKDKNYYELRGNAHLMKKDYQAAISDYTQGIKLSPGNYFLYMSRGIVYDSLGNLELALKDYEVGMSIDSTNVKMYIPSIKVLIKHKKYKEALLICDKAYKLQFNEWRVLLNRGIIGIATGDTTNACDDFKEAVYHSEIVVRMRFSVEDSIGYARSQQMLQTYCR